MTFVKLGNTVLNLSAVGAIQLVDDGTATVSTRDGGVLVTLDSAEATAAVEFFSTPDRGYGEEVVRWEVLAPETAPVTP